MVVGWHSLSLPAPQYAARLITAAWQWMSESVRVSEEMGECRWNTLSLPAPQYAARLITAAWQWMSECVSDSEEVGE